MAEDDVKARVEQIRKIADDDEAAHSNEDRLRHDVLQAIADGTAVDPIACAKAALLTSEIEFCRWCA